MHLGKRLTIVAMEDSVTEQKVSSMASCEDLIAAPFVTGHEFTHPKEISKGGGFGFRSQANYSFQHGF